MTPTFCSLSLLEISIKYGLGKLSLEGLTPEDFFGELSRSRFVCRQVDPIIMATSYKLPLYHRDPFDRIIIWDAIQADMRLISADERFAEYKSEGLKLIYD